MMNSPENKQTKKKSRARNWDAIRHEFRWTTRNRHACAAIGCKNPDGAITIWDDVPHGLEVLVSGYLAETDE